MAKTRNKIQQSSSTQVDIFGFIEEVEWSELKVKTEAIDLNDLIQGDLVRFKTHSGTTLEGAFVTKGFWDGRDQDKPIYFYIDVDGYFVEISRFNEWVKIGHDSSYVPPRKDNMTERLIELIQGIPFTKRLETYQYVFRKQYPDLSYEYHPYVSKAWNEAMLAVTTEEEVIANKDQWKWTSKLPNYVNQFIRNNIFYLPANERLEAVNSMRWVEVKQYGGSLHFWSYYLPKRQMTYHKDLFSSLIETTTNPEHLAMIARFWGIQTFSIEKPLPAQFYLEKENGDIEVIIPFPDDLANLIVEPEEEELDVELVDDADMGLDEEFEDDDLENIA